MFSRIVRTTLFALSVLVMVPNPSTAKTIQIAGPSGPLEGEAIPVENAEHVLVIIPGSGPIDRDGNGFQAGLQSNTYRLLAEDMAKVGVASLRVDKRGFFGSEAAIADPNDVTIAKYADDARDWIRAASDLAPCVWLTGHSEGGLVALAAAMDAPLSLCGVILLATGGRPTGQILLYQMSQNPAMAPLMPELSSVVADLEAGQTRDVETIPLQLQALFAPGLQRYMIDLFSYDPLALAKQWTKPALVVQGDHDIQVTPTDADMLMKAMPQAKRVDLVDGTHMLKTDQPGQPFVTYTDPDLPLHPDLVPAIVDFIEAHAP
ncbi:alpha/beta hydrolase [Thalassococcus sp. S3]|uniref:alpha/beta hydrolase n=1 Tax=Thalassococcus sp. S3 TaxID=2017482 RepID=UPI0010241D15|nr:alpha/beta fold hydrolase [Thalassococcus sp. S3]QBF33517.1 alpha/beta hydrolase [Thalassococcus sp. S3]